MTNLDTIMESQGESDLMFQTCPECTGDNIYSMTTEDDAKQTWHCSACQHQWPGNEDDHEIDLS